MSSGRRPPRRAAAGAAGGSGAFATGTFVGHMQFFALTSNAAANMSVAYKDTNDDLGELQHLPGTGSWKP